MSLLHRARGRVLHLLAAAAEDELREVYEALSPSALSPSYKFSNEVELAAEGA